MSSSLAEIATKLPEIVKQAGELILTHYTDNISTRRKEGGSPVTDADEEAEDLIIERLQQLAPDIPIVAEESVERDGLPKGALPLFFLVDPLDGTREFINGNGEFTVNIALIKDGQPIIGAINVPAKNETYWTDENGNALFESAEGKQSQINCKAPDADGLVVVASRSHRDEATDELLSHLKVKDAKAAGSSLKLCLVAKGEADLYPRLGRTMEWDIAAGHAILAAAGGKILRMDGTPLTYGKDGYDNPKFIAMGTGTQAEYGL